MRLIDADALINELNNSHYPGAPYVDAGISIAIGKVCDAQTIEPEQQWIPVSDRLPNYNVAVLVTEKNGRVCVAYLDDVLMGEWYDGDLNAIEPIAWTKMPEPYKGEQDASRTD